MIKPWRQVLLVFAWLIQTLAKVNVPGREYSGTQGLSLGIERSLTYLSKPSSQMHYPIAGIQHQQVVDALTRMRELLQSNAS